MDQKKRKTRGTFAAWREPAGSFVFFFFLLILPVTTIWLTCSTVQSNLEADQQQQCLDEMAEMTAHMTRLADPETYFQEALRRMNDSFRWASEPAEISRLSDPETLELYLFDEDGKRLAWPPEETQTRRKISEDYLKLLVRARQKQGAALSRTEQNLAATFAGSCSTVGSLARSPDTLVNFQGIGLRRLGAWFDTRLPGNHGGYLLAWVDPDRINRYQLAEQAVHKIQNLAGNDFSFAWVDLNNTGNNGCTRGRRFHSQGLRIITADGLKSSFQIGDELFSINDTPEGIRLVCSRFLPDPPPIMANFFNILRTVVPVIVLFLIWKTFFMVRFDLSASLQFIMIFGFTAITGGSILLSASIAYQYEKQNSLIADYKQKAVEILEKIDRNFSASYGDHLHQYRHLISLLGKPGSKPETVLAPLTAAHQEENIAFAGYTDQNGNFVFRAPGTTAESSLDSIESKYSNLISGISSQIIKAFNSSRMPGNTYSSGGEINIKSLSARPVEGLLGNRSTLQNIVFDGDETLSFMDLVIDDRDTASGCLFIVHEPRKMQLKYLAISSQNLAKTGFDLAAFPKKQIEKSAYFPRFSYTTELPLWKLHDLVNQTQVSSFKSGRIEDREVLVAAIAGHNLKNYNLFLIMPFEQIKKEARKLSSIFIAATAMALLFILVLSLILVSSLIRPITRLAANATALQSSQSNNLEAVVFSEANELESISTGLTDLILKVREFNEGRSVKRHLLPPEPLIVGSFFLGGFQIANSREEKEIYHFACIDEGLSLAFLLRTDLNGIEASLTLSMARMAIRLISEELNVHSAYHCVKDLEEYFRINLRRKLGGDILAVVVNHAENRLTFSGCGAIKLVLIDSTTRQVTTHELPACEAGSSEFHSFANQEVDFGPGMIAFAVSPVFSAMCSQKLPEMLSTIIEQNKAGTSLQNYMQKQVEAACASNFSESASLIIIQNNHCETGKS